MQFKNIKRISTSVFVIGALLFFCAMSSEAAPGHLDPTFSGDGRLIDGVGWATDVAVQPDGKIVVINGMFIVRYNPDGTLDASFGNGTGRVVTNFAGGASIRGFAIQPDGKIAVGGVAGTMVTLFFVVARFNSDGSPDLSFGAGTGQVFTPLPCGDSNNNFGADFTMHPDGKMVGAVKFEYCPGQLLRYRWDGELDPFFGTNGIVTTTNAGSDHFHSITVQANGKIVVIGERIPGLGERILRFEANGSPDLGFNVGFQPLQGAVSVVAQPDSKVLVCGSINNGSDLDFGVVRFNGDGSPDTSFNGIGSVTTPIGPANDFATSMAVQSDGRIVVGGYSNGDFVLVRYNTNGSLDSTFGSGDGITTTDFGNSGDSAFALALDYSGRAVLVGNSNSDSTSNLAIARFRLGNLSAPSDFDGDGRSDISVFRPSDRVWYLNQSTNGFASRQFGLSTDSITPADFDGDGKTDIAVFRDGVWWKMNSSNDTVAATSFGLPGDIPVPADFSGDGHAELAVYRGGTWWTLNLVNGEVASNQFGVLNDKPVAADYDDDGRADQGVYRTGEWHLNQSTQGYAIANFGIATDIPVVGDYDGDGRTDLAVYRGGTWYLMRSTQGFAAFQWGLPTDIPTPADYDGDGKTDASVYRNGIWYQLRSTAGISIQQFGAETDQPVPAAYVP